MYPESPEKKIRELDYLANFFNVVEVNSTFYRPANPFMSEAWVRKVAHNPDFLFTAKLWQRFTHEREEPWSRDDVQVFRDGIAPLVQAGRLGALLAQFPWSFRYSRASEEHLRALAGEFGDLPLVVEVRSRAWLQDEALAFIESLGAGFCNIDQPQFRSNIPLTAHAFGPVGYLRLHGRNAEAWFDKEAGRDARYDYLYRSGEMDEIQDALDRIAQRVERMFVIANNHYRGQAVAAGLSVIRRITGEDPGGPGRVAELYGYC